jgi:WD40 repeat protein
VYDVCDFKQKAILHGKVEHASERGSFSHNGSKAVSAGKSNQLFCYSYNNVDEIQVDRVLDRVVGGPVDISENGEWIVYTWEKDPILDLMESQTHKVFSRIQCSQLGEPFDSTSQEHILPEAKRLIGFSNIHTERNCLTPLQISESKNSTPNPQHSYQFTTLNLSDNGQKCLAGTTDGAILFIEFGEEVAIQKLSVFDCPLIDVAFNSIGKYIAALGDNNEIIVWSY